MQTISATYRVTTPMFLGGAEQQAELRLPSFKGMLRFWWRAMASNRVKDSGQLRDEESALFGSSDEQIGQSKVLMRLERMVPTPKTISPPAQLKDGSQVVGPGARYLGYGVMEAFASGKKGTKEGELTRSCLSSPFTFTVSLLPKSAFTSQQREEIVEALKVLGLTGGLGSKSRKGYGSLTLLSLKVDGKDTWTLPETADQVATAIRTLLGPTRISASKPSEANQTSLPEWTAFSESSRVVILSADNQDRTPLALLDRIGCEMVRYRSWGHHGRVFGCESEKNFEDDHDLMKLDWKRRKSHPRRIVFGLPHNYGKESTQQVEPADSYDRRSSPLFIHIHQPSEQSPPIAVLTFLPSCFLPEEAGGISVGKRERGPRGSGDWEKRTVALVGQDLWNPIHTFLNRMLGRSPNANDCKEPFGTVTEVTHG